MIQTTLGQLVDAEPALQRLATQKMSAASAYTLAKLCKAVAEETKIFTARRIDLIKEVGVERAATAVEQARGETTMVEVAPPRMAGFMAQITEMAAVQVTITLAPLKLATLGPIEISAADLLTLGPLVAEPDGTAA